MAVIKRFLFFAIIIVFVIVWVGFRFRLVKMRHGRIVLNTTQHRSITAYQDNCPLEGSAKEDGVRELNKLKNRDYLPEEKDFDREITTGLLLKPGDDRNRWDDNYAAEISGYVAEVKTSEPESVL